MKTIIALVATAAAVKINDAPSYFNEPTWRQTWPSASGLVQVESQSACERFGVAGVTCGPADAELFATGMEGTESLDEEIRMKGQKYAYGQHEKALVQLNQAPFPQYESLAPEKVLTPQTTWARYHTTYF